MPVAPSLAWKVLLAVVLGAVILFGACGTAPRRSVPRSDLQRLVFSALCLYAVGAVASLTHRSMVAAFTYAAGVSVCALALWLSRGVDSGEDPPRNGDEPGDKQPPPGPDGAGGFDWAAFEREFRGYAERRRPSRSGQPTLR